MKNIIAMVAVLILATGCAAHKHEQRTKQVSNVDSSVSAALKNTFTETNISTVDTCITIAADTLNYELPTYLLCADDSINGNIFPADGLVINTPTAKALFTKEAKKIKARIILPQRMLPITQYNYHTTTSTKDSNTNVQVVSNQTKQDVIKEKKKNPVQQIIAAGVLLFLVAFIIYQLKKAFF